MAEQQPLSPVLLGFVDEEITSKFTASVNHRTNKIGGLPDFPTLVPCSVPVCCGCGAEQALVVQLYVPVFCSPDHRTLYMFACLTPTCWDRPYSWTCLRVQTPATPPPSSSTSRHVPTIIADTSTMFDVPDEWASDSDPDDNNANTTNSTNVASITDSDNSNINKTLSHYGEKDETSRTNANLNLLLNLSGGSDNQSGNMNNRAAASGSSGNININNKNANNMETIEATETLGMDRLNLNQNGGGVGRGVVAGAIGEAGGVGGGEVLCGDGGEDEATAVIEGSEGDMVAVDTPDLPTVDIAAWFMPLARPPPDWVCPEYLRPHFIYCEEERGAGVPTITQHERALLHAYTAQTGALHDHEDKSGGRGGGGSGDGAYVREVAPHGDVYLHKLKKRVAVQPDQIIRYCRDSGCGPLLLRPLTGMEGAKCRLCRAPLVFEVQIMPQLIPHLKPLYANLNTTKKIAKPGMRPAISKTFDYADDKVTKDSSVESGSVNLGSSQSDSCRSTRSKYASSKNRGQSGSLSTESAESVDMQETFESLECSNDQQIKSKNSMRNKNFNAESMIASGVVEYGVVLIFTCSKSCWHGKPVLEAVVVQPENMHISRD